MSASWEFAALLVGLSGFLFTIGVLLAMVVLDSGFFTSGPFARLAARWPWLQTAWVAALVLYLLLLARRIILGLRARRDVLSIFNIDADALRDAIQKILVGKGHQTRQEGNVWYDGTKPLIEMVHFPVFRHVSLNMLAPEASWQQAFESELRSAIPRLPAAQNNPAIPWLNAATLCCVVASGCCIALVFASPYLR